MRQLALVNALVMVLLAVAGRVVVGRARAGGAEHRPEPGRRRTAHSPAYA
ncbi:MAG: hypothetical protein HOW59_05060 [Nonomuraea sp.]|nr:hypothetical protein [Nonomuraea sp.]